MSTQKKTKRRKKGEGSIKYHENRRSWEVRLTYGRLSNGKIDRRSKSAKSYEDAIFELEQMKEKAALLKNLNNPTTLLREYAYKWLNERDIKEPTYKSQICIMDNQIVPYIGEYPICDITTNTIRELFSDLKKKNYSNKTIQRTHTLLYQLFWQAMCDNTILRSPMFEIPLEQVLDYK